MDERAEGDGGHVDGCAGCEIARGDRAAPGGVLLREGGFVLHALADASPLRGWLVLTAERHVRGWYDLPDPEAAALGPLAARVMRAQRAALGAEHVYAFAIGDVLRHFHLHLVPRFANTPGRLRGRGCFGARPEDLLPEAEVTAAARAVAGALGYPAYAPRPASGVARPLQPEGTPGDGPGAGGTSAANPSRKLG